MDEAQAEAEESERPLPRQRSFWRIALLVAVGATAFYIAWRVVTADRDLVLRDRPGARPLYLAGPLAEEVLAASRRASALLHREDGVVRVESGALFRVSDEDWLAACALLRRAASDLRVIADDGQAGVRPAPPIERLRGLRAEAERVCARFEAEEQLQRGRLAEELRAFLRALAKLLAALPDPLR